MLQQIDVGAPLRKFLGGADYELRLLDSKGGTIRVYRARHASEEDARRMLLDIRGIDYHRFEIWRGMAKVCEGPALIVC
ncbi:MAG TPA: hypothetical protein VIM56_14005 [Rhizomicrobium sp.]